MKFKTGLGQDSHAFENNKKTLLLAGVDCKHAQGLRANSDGDVVLHALTNAVSSITGINILGEKADYLCQQGIVDSREYLKLALQDLNTWQVQHISISIECLKPKISLVGGARLAQRFHSPARNASARSPRNAPPSEIAVATVTRL